MGVFASEGNAQTRIINLVMLAPFHSLLDTMLRISAKHRYVSLKFLEVHIFKMSR